MNISEKITALRQALRLSQEELAVRIGVTRQTVVGWEQGATPSLFNRRRICEEFELPLNYFDDDVSSVLVPVPSAKGQAVLAESAAPAPEAETCAPPVAPPADTALDTLDRVIRWGSIVLLGILVCFGFVAAMSALIALFGGAEGDYAAYAVAVNFGDVYAVLALYLAAAVLFYGTTFLIRLILLDRANVRGRNVRS